MKISKKWTLVLPVAAVLLLAAGCSSSSSSGKRLIGRKPRQSSPTIHRNQPTRYRFRQ